MIEHRISVVWAADDSYVTASGWTKVKPCERHKVTEYLRDHPSAGSALYMAVDKLTALVKE